MRDLPKHVMIVIDDKTIKLENHEFSSVEKNKADVKVAEAIIYHSVKLNINSLSLVINKNSKRLSREQADNLFASLLLEKSKEFHQNNIKVFFTSNTYPENIKHQILNIQSLTINNSGMVLNIVLNYSSHSELVEATQKLMSKCHTDDIYINDINESMLNGILLNFELGEPELFIRTGGEYNLSDVFLWQLAYSELYFIDKSWADFSCNEFDLAIDWFCNRERRFGQTSEQLGATNA